MIYKRNLLEDIVETLEDNPVVLINKPRQIGKSTLLTDLLSQDIELTYITLDDTQDLYSLQGDPESFLSQYHQPIAIDEIQRALDVFVTFKKIVDEQRKPGQFIVTGSINILTLPKLSESLSGRMILHNMWPLSQGEISGIKEDFITALFTNSNIVFSDQLGDEDWVEIMVKGGYPTSFKA